MIATSGTAITKPNTYAYAHHPDGDRALDARLPAGRPDRRRHDRDGIGHQFNGVTAVKFGTVAGTSLLDNSPQSSSSPPRPAPGWPT